MGQGRSPLVTLAEGAVAAWDAEASKPLRDRQLFRFSEVGMWLAREPGRLKADLDEARRIVADIFEWYERGEFDPSDVLVLTGPDPPYFVAVPAFLRSSRDPQERTTREEEIRNRHIVDFLILRRPALRLYLSQCGLEGVLRLSRELGFEEPAAAAHEPVMCINAGDTADGLSQGTKRPNTKGPMRRAKPPIPALKDDLQARYDQRVTKDHAPTLIEDEAWRKQEGITRTSLKELRGANSDRRLHQVGPRTKHKP